MSIAVVNMTWSELVVFIDKPIDWSNDVFNNSPNRLQLEHTELFTVILSAIFILEYTHLLTCLIRFIVFVSDFLGYLRLCSGIIHLDSTKFALFLLSHCIGRECRLGFCLPLGIICK